MLTDANVFFFIVVVCLFAAKISITQRYESKIAIVFFGQIILLFCKYLMKSLRNVQKQRKKINWTHNWIYRRYGIYIKKTDCYNNSNKFSLYYIDQVGEEMVTCNNLKCDVNERKKIEKCSDNMIASVSFKEKQMMAKKCYSI